MEKRIREYEKFIKKAAENPTAELREYHFEMMRNFQQERLIHLIITLFFSGLTVVMLGVAAWMSFYVDWWVVLPLFFAVIILAVVSGFYIKHYYFLENHIQKLYDITKKISLK